MSGLRLAIGLMSGTSMDGVDVALIETDGRAVGAFRPTQFRPYSDEERAALRAALAAGPALKDRWERPPVVAEAERIVTEAHADAVRAFMVQNGLTADAVAVVGFHGQTVFHAPGRGLTIQIGDGLALARALGIRVVYDFRSADVAAGGEGAPLVPAYHAALVARAGLKFPAAVLNIGGVANLTWIGGPGEGAEDLVAFDTGPGNALIDDWCHSRTERPVDSDGRLAAKGRVDPAVLDRLLAHPYFIAKPPKSLDRNAFSAAPCEALSTADGAATLTAFTAAAVARSLDLVPERPGSLVVAGGGAHNPTLMRMIAERANTEVIAASDIGWSTDFLEAQAFGFLAVRHLEGLPISFPGTTGVAQPTGGGVLAVP
ncbi:anhydro-N-acetylmuramic acid kinase [Prosthecomicrobium sp. N25]|uniref:anhydro-N-acetylmuramic acid kinase n=1 Tax=Prosthecomicrobium sp. N25 TaxID=3129254 RepID=UPI0030773FE8